VKTAYDGKEALSRVKVVERDLADQVKLQLPLPVAGLMVDLQEEVERFGWECGRRLIEACIESEAERIAGPRYEHDPERKAYRGGKTSGWAYYGGSKAAIKRQRVRGEGGEVALESVRAFQQDGKMQRAVAAKVLAGVKMRRYEGCMDAVCEGYGVRKSSISRHWVKASAKALQELAERRLDDLALAAIIIDGVRFREVCAVVALGVDYKGYKHVLGLYAGAMENGATCQGLLDDLIRRGLDAKGKYLFVIDGSKALRSAIRKTFGEEAPVQRCQVHKKRNVKEHLPKSYHRALSLRLTAAYGMREYADARAELEKTVKWLEGISASAADSLREGLEETLTLHRLGVPAVLRVSLSSTNLIESCFSTTRGTTRRVKRWRGDDQVVRWAGAVLLDAESRFHRVRGYAAMSVLLNCLGLKAVDSVSSVA